MYFENLIFLVFLHLLNPTASDKVSSDLLVTLNRRILNQHNSFRRLHNSPVLQYNETLREYAQKWADNLAENNKFEHRTGTPYGENLWKYKSTTEISLEDVMIKPGMDPVETWYAEIKYYPKGTFQQYGHYTQVIWKSSIYLGCGIGLGQNKRILIIVCNYAPPGNLLAARLENVLPSQTDKKEKVPVYFYVIVGVIILSIIALLIFLLYASSE